MTKQQPAKINVSTRRDKATGEPVLFFYNTSPRGYWLECYAHVGQHSEASKEYLRFDTTPAPTTAPDVAALVAEWENLGPPADRIPAHCVARLPVPRGFNYIGK